MDKTNVTTLMDNIDNEIGAIAQKGLNSSNFDTCYRLVDMRYKLETIKCFCNTKSTCYDDYMNAKRIYKHEHTIENQNKIIDSLETYMYRLTDSISNMVNDCDCDREKQIIKNYIAKL